MTRPTALEDRLREEIAAYLGRCDIHYDVGHGLVRQTAEDCTDWAVDLTSLVLRIVGDETATALRRTR